MHSTIKIGSAIRSLAYLGANHMPEQNILMAHSVHQHAGTIKRVASVSQRPRVYGGGVRGGPLRYSHAPPCYVLAVVNDSDTRSRMRGRFALQQLHRTNRLHHLGRKHRGCNACIIRGTSRNPPALAHGAVKVKLVLRIVRFPAVDVVQSDRPPPISFPSAAGTTGTTGTNVAGNVLRRNTAALIFDLEQEFDRRRMFQMPRPESDDVIIERTSAWISS